MPFPTSNVQRVFQRAKENPIQQPIRIANMITGAETEGVDSVNVPIAHQIKLANNVNIVAAKPPPAKAPNHEIVSSLSAIALAPGK